MDWYEIAGIAFGSGALSSVITTLLTQHFQRRENRFDPRREVYAQFLAALDTFEQMAGDAHHRAVDEAVLLMEQYRDMIQESSHPLSRPLANVQLLAPDRTLSAAEDVVERYNQYFIGRADRRDVHKAHNQLLTLMRKDLGSVS